MLHCGIGNRPLRILHAIHDFLPRHQAGSEVYVAALCRALGRQHHVAIVTAEYDPAREHGSVTWRLQDGIPVAEIVNNWACESFEDTFQPATIERTLEHVFAAVTPDVVHVHNLLNLSFGLPVLARRIGAAIVATLHDYTLVCASGGQRVHRAEQHVCEDIDSHRCARCFSESPWASQIAFARLAASQRGRGFVLRAASRMRAHFPRAFDRTARLAQHTVKSRVAPDDIDRRHVAARRVFAEFDLVSAPSAALAREFERMGFPVDRMIVADYGFDPWPVFARPVHAGPLRIGFVGTLTWHKGAHVLIEAVRNLDSTTYELRIAGDPDVFPDYSADLRARAAGLPARFTGAFRRDEAPKVYSELDVLVVPSLWPENSPLVIHEAFMAGVPVIGFRVGGIPELVARPGAGRVVEPTAAALTRALREVVAAPSLLDEWRLNVPPVRTIDEDARDWTARYREVLARRVKTA